MSHADLIARLEALTGPDRLSDANILWAVDPEAFKSDEGDDADHLKPSYCYGRSGWTMNRADRAHLDRIPVPRLTASLDAAVALVERVLPGKTVLIGWGQTEQTVPWARVGPWSEPDATGATPAIALLIATLKAMEQQNG
ncbi:hypothetical protein CO731_04904 [Aminobacter sp. MSH1]|uniref:hypothetical protein n=1 Tax=Aminobacter sp. MSH1 TaxID=374606 RepID=UPI000D3C0E3E|nr:hypothetical protein [Aminobacter sp. MSH1]AWC25409.1 hypothetical protein CO731_04904 [Aminobacter sp. MSH1]